MPSTTLDNRPDLIGRETSLTSALDHHPEDRPLVYGHIANYKDSPQASVQGVINILNGGMRLSGNGRVWMFTIAGDINKMVESNDGRIPSEEEIDQTDIESLDRFFGQCASGKAGFVIVGGKGLRGIVEEQLRGIALCSERSIFDGLFSPNRFLVFYRGLESEDGFKKIKGAVDNANQYRQANDLPQILLVSSLNQDSLIDPILSLC